MLRSTILVLSLALFATGVRADVRADIAKKFPGTTEADIRTTPMQGLYELRRGGDVV